MKKSGDDLIVDSIVRRKFLRASLSLGSTLTLGSLRAEGHERNEFSLTTEDRIALALMRFRNGFHCSQCVLEAYAEDFGFEPELTRRLAAALAGGSTVGGECGAVGSAYVVLGLKFGKTLPAHGDVEREAGLWRRVRDFVADFERRHGAINCRELLGVDVFTRKGREKALRENLFVDRCPEYIRSSITILDSL